MLIPLTPSFCNRSGDSVWVVCSSNWVTPTRNTSSQYWWKDWNSSLERLTPTLSMQPTVVERLEFEYERHGTQFNCQFGGSNRTSDCSLNWTDPHRSWLLAHIQQTVVTDPTGVWIFITDQLNIHQSESLVRWVTLVCGLNQDLG